MTKKDSESQDFASELAPLRRQIDDIDDKLIELFTARTQVVNKVGALKHKYYPGICPIRPGREAEMVRRVIAKSTGSAFTPASAAAIWRILIGMSTSLESALSLSVFTPERNEELSWLAREYFGPSIPITRQPHIKRVIGDVIDGKASVGIVPLLRSSDTSYWWTNLMQPGNNLPKVFAYLPFVYSKEPGNDAPAALAIARLEPEPSGDDISLFVLETDHNVSQHRLQTLFAKAKLEVTWINIATLTPANRHHLISVKGFVTAASPSMKEVLDALAGAAVHVSFLGAYAAPVVLNASNQKAAHGLASSNA